MSVDEGVDEGVDEVRELCLPLSEQDARSLRVGDQVSLTGPVTMSIGLPTHKRMAELLGRGEALPLDLAGGAFVHLSSYNRESKEAPAGFEALYLNPSTSTRYDEYMPSIIAKSGVRVVGGKGGLSAACVAAMREAGCVYLSFLGGGCTLLSHAIRGVASVHWNEYISQFRLVTLNVERLCPATVAIDANGNSVYDSLRTQAQARLPDILDKLDKARAASE